MDLNTAITSRTSVRSYTNKAVDRSIIEELLIAAWHAPCSCNLQLMQYVIVDDPQLQEQLSKVATKKMLWAPVNIFFFIDPRFTAKRHSSIMGLGAAMQNMSLTALEHGLATCPMAGFEGDEQVKKILGVPQELEAILILGVGYPDESLQPKLRQRLPVVSNRYFNKMQTPSILNESVDIDDWSATEVIDYRQRIAPVYRYHGRFSLHTYRDQIYRTAVEQFLLLATTGSKTIDLHTYDTYFHKLLQAAATEDVSFSVSDFLPYILETAAKDFPNVHPIEITADGKFESSEASFTSATLVHKIQVTPQPEKLFTEAHRILVDGGVLFVTIPQESWLKGLLYYVRNIIRRLQKTVNVYEGNASYKIGPQRIQSATSVDTLAYRAGFTKQTGTRIVVEDSGFLPHQMYCAVYVK